MTSPCAIPKEFVHKAHERNQWVDRWLPDPGKQAFTAVRPLCLATASMAELVELQRQAGTAFAHLNMGVPLDRVFMLSRIRTERVSGPGVSDAAEPLRIDVSLERSASKGSQALETDFAFFLSQGETVVEGRSTAVFVSPRLYPRLRSGQRSAGLEPPRMERIVTSLVVDDPTHPLTSDHASDHLSAMTMLLSVEAQLEKVSQGGVASLDARFASYVGLDGDAVLSVGRTDSPSGYRGGLEHQGLHRMVFDATTTSKEGKRK